MDYAFWLAERFSFVQNLRFTNYVTLLNFPCPCWHFQYFPRGELFSQGASHMFLLLLVCFCSLFTCIYVVYLCVCCFFQSYRKWRQNTRNYLRFSFFLSFFLRFLVCTCTWHVFPLSLSSSLAIFPNPLLQRGCGQRKCSSMGPSLGLIW